ncbi:hypothetical protein DFH05DRAFT_1192928 [Lentinula detonsa]|uniref:Uncharacterized protein n=1 Tax=Lentinula detonsa TaxID=2804962 RepID=A0A9W8P0W0_9AGAR|nr:hypothetical protein DFH05DRAFT_1192928 [Lentinula detonsa]
MTPAQSRANRSLPGSRAHSVDATSFHTPAMSTVNSKRSSMLGPARNEPPPVPSVIPEVVPATPSIRSAASVRSSRLPSLSRTPTENATRVDPSRDQSRGRSAVSRGKERAITSPPIDESSSTTSTSNRNSSSRLADTLSSVWGAVSPTARSIAESLKSKEATPLSSPVKRELREILHAPPPPPDPIPFTAEEAPMSAVDMPGAFESGISVGEVDQSQTEPAPVVESFSEAAAWGSFTSAGEATGANMGPTNLRISTALSNRAPSAVISPITLPEMNVDRSTQPIAEAGMLSLSNEPLINSNESSDLLSPPESAPSSTHNLAELLNTATPGLKSPTNATSPVSTSSKNTWSTKASPKPSSSPNATNPTTPAIEVQATASKSPWGTPKPAATPKAASKAASKNPSKAATPLASMTPKPAATPKVATPIPASSPRVETIELLPTTSEQQVESAVAETHPSKDEIAAPDTTTQKTETHIENAASEPAGEPAADTAAPVPSDEATPAEAAEAQTAPTAAETPAEPETSVEIPETSDASKEDIGGKTMVAATLDESAPETAPGTPGDGLNGADIEGRGEEGDEKEAKEEDEQANTPGGKKKKKKKKNK